MLQSCLCIVFWILVSLSLLWSYSPFQSFQLSLHCFAWKFFRRSFHILNSHSFNQPFAFCTHHCTDIAVTTTSDKLHVNSVTTRWLHLHQVLSNIYYGVCFPGPETYFLLSALTTCLWPPWSVLLRLLSWFLGIQLILVFGTHKSLVLCFIIFWWEQ